MEILENVDIKNFTSYHLSNVIPKLFVPNGMNELVELIKEFIKVKQKFVVLGNGSNVIFSPNFKEFVICTKNISNIKKLKEDVLEVECGCLDSVLLKYMENEALSGAEFLTGIPGTVGASVITNVGAFKSAMSDIVKEVEYIDSYGNIRKIKAKNCEFCYRDSIFKNTQNVITKVKIKAQKCEKNIISKKIHKIINERIVKLPMGFSCGSVFKNPPGDYAGRLIESVGLNGYAIGGAKISEKHANFIINFNNAKSEDVLKLIEIAKSFVYNKYNIMLETEVVIL